MKYEGRIVTQGNTLKIDFKSGRFKSINIKMSKLPIITFWVGISE